MSSLQPVGLIEFSSYFQLNFFRSSGYTGQQGNAISGIRIFLMDRQKLGIGKLCKSSLAVWVKQEKGHNNMWMKTLLKYYLNAVLNSSRIQRISHLLPHLVLKIHFSLKHSNKYKRSWKYMKITFCKHHTASQFGLNLYILHFFLICVTKIFSLFLTFYFSLVIHIFFNTQAFLLREQLSKCHGTLVFSKHNFKKSLI